MWHAGGSMPIGMSAIPTPGQPVNCVQLGNGLQPPLPGPGESGVGKPPLPDIPIIDVNPAPPVEPPKEEQPPLPPEPPPNDDSGQELMPKDETEQMKLTALQQQAAQWQQQTAQWQQAQQWHQYEESVQMYQQSQVASSLDLILEEERQFDIQYRDWKKQYNDWKEQNKNHPNQEQFSQYEQQWKTYEVQMEQKRHNILLRKEQAMQQGQYAAPHAAAVHGAAAPPAPRFLTPTGQSGMPPPFPGNLGAPVPPPPPPSFPPPPPPSNPEIVYNQNLPPSQTGVSVCQPQNTNTPSHLETKSLTDSHSSRVVSSKVPAGTRPNREDPNPQHPSYKDQSNYRQQFKGPYEQSQNFDRSLEHKQELQNSEGSRQEGPLEHGSQFEGLPGPRFERPPEQRPRLDGPPGQGPRFDRPHGQGPPTQRPRFDGPAGQRPRFDGPAGQRPRFDGPAGQRPRFDGPTEQRPRFDGPLGQRPRFEGPPGPRPRFEGPPGPRPRFEGPPGQRPRFEGPPSQRPRFEGPPGQRPRFEGPPGQRPRFEGPPGQRPRFEGPPGQRPRFEGHPAQQTNFEGSHGQRATLDGPPGRGKQLNTFGRPFNRGQRGGMSRGQKPLPNAPVSLLDLKLDRPPTLGKSDVIQEDIDFEDVSNFEGNASEEPVSASVDDFNRRGFGAPRPFGRGRGMPRGRAPFGRGMGRDLSGTEYEEEDMSGLMEADEFGGQEVFEEEMVENFDMHDHGMPEGQFRGQSRPYRGMPPSRMSHRGFPEGGLRGRGGQRFRGRRGMFGHHGPWGDEPMFHDEMGGGDMMESEDNELHQGMARPDSQHDFDQRQDAQLRAPHQEEDCGQFTMDESPHLDLGDTDQTNLNKTPGVNNSMTKERNEQMENKMQTKQRNTDDNQKEGSEEDRKRTQETGRPTRWNQLNQGDNQTSQSRQSDGRNDGSHLNDRLSEERSHSRWQAQNDYDRGDDSQLMNDRRSFDRSAGGSDNRQFGEDLSNRHNQMAQSEGLPQLRRDDWNLPDRKMDSWDTQLRGGSSNQWRGENNETEQINRDYNRCLPSQEEQKPAVPILSQHELDIIKQATEELKMIQGQKGQQDTTPVKDAAGQDPFLNQKREFTRDQSLVERAGGVVVDYDDSLSGPRPHDPLDRPSRYPNRDTYREQLYSDPYRYERVEPPLRTDVYDREPFKRDYMLPRDPLSTRDPILVRERLLQRDPLIGRDQLLARDSLLGRDPVAPRDPLLGRDPVVPRDPLLAADNLYDPLYPRRPPADLVTTPQVIDYGHGQADDTRTRQYEPDRDRRRSPNRDYDYESRYHSEDRGRDLPRAFDVETDRDRDRYQRDRSLHDRDRIRSHDRLGHYNRERDRDRSHDRDRRDESPREQSHGRERKREYLRRDRSEDRFIVNRHDNQDKRNSPLVNTPSSTSSSSSTYPKSKPSHSLPPKKEEKGKVELILVDEILCDPGRSRRPDHIVVIVRGLPGSGKSYLCKLLKDKEKLAGGSAARILALDDYFMVEVEKVMQDEETGKRVKKSVMEYEYDPDLEDGYKQSFLKSFRRQIDDGYFNFFIVDATFDSVKYLQEFWAYAKSKGFQVYVAEVTAEPSVCAKRNIHKRSVEDIQKIAARWDSLPNHYIQLDVRSLLQDAAITEVEMEDMTDADPPTEKEESQTSTTEEEETSGVTSKWEIDTSDAQLDKLDGLRHGKMSVHHRMEDYLQLPDDYDTRTSEPGKKRVRWADIEERKSQARMRDIGFVLGQTNWDKMIDDSYADRALNQTKYI